MSVTKPQTFAHVCMCRYWPYSHMAHCVVDNGVRDRGNCDLLLVFKLPWAQAACTPTNCIPNAHYGQSCSLRIPTRSSHAKLAGSCRVWIPPTESRHVLIKSSRAIRDRLEQPLFSTLQLCSIEHLPLGVVPWTAQVCTIKSFDSTCVDFLCPVCQT